MFCTLAISIKIDLVSCQNILWPWAFLFKTYLEQERRLNCEFFFFFFCRNREPRVYFDQLATVGVDWNTELEIFFLIGSVNFCKKNNTFISFQYYFNFREKVSRLHHGLTVDRFSFQSLRIKIDLKREHLRARKSYGINLTKKPISR